MSPRCLVNSAAAAECRFTLVSGYVQQIQVLPICSATDMCAAGTSYEVQIVAGLRNYYYDYNFPQAQLKFSTAFRESGATESIHTIDSTTAYRKNLLAPLTAPDLRLVVLDVAQPIAGVVQDLHIWAELQFEIVPSAVVAIQFPDAVTIPTLPACQEVLYLRKSLACSKIGNSVQIQLTNTETASYPALSFTISAISFQTEQVYTGFHLQITAPSALDGYTTVTLQRYTPSISL